MNLIGLPGRNSETRAWLENLASSLKLGQRDVHVAHYRHWDTGAEPDVGFEAGMVQGSAADLVIAKSMGTMVILQAYALGFTPAAAVMIGVPLSAYDDVQKSALRQFASEVPCLFIQQTADITASFTMVEDELEGINGATLAEVPGSDHMYMDIAALQRIIESWAAAALLQR